MAAEELFLYTFWADLRALANPDEPGAGQRHFHRGGENGTYVLVAPAPEDIPANACLKKTD